ncbi:hypothetical protein [Anaerobutyricum soehngenii]
MAVSIDIFRSRERSEHYESRSLAKKIKMEVLHSTNLNYFFVHFTLEH